jgi:predicted transposase/invertase (TIGR01784 family)
LDKYESSLKVYRDLKGVIDTAYLDGKLEGMAEGIQEGKIEGRLQGIQEGKIEGRLEAKLDVARALKNHGVALDVIINTTGLSKEEIERL